ncbi:MAG: hypothetical protein J5851_08900 [Oscillospiraceae bacterium]|nr:hypothetical protein [Oscillospiraceae bacterium]
MTTVLGALATLFTALAYIAAAVLACLAIAVLIEQRNARRLAIKAAKAEQQRRWAEMVAVAKLMQEQKDETFEYAVNYGRIRRYPDDFKEAQ